MSGTSELSVSHPSNEVYIHRVSGAHKYPSQGRRLESSRDLGALANSERTWEGLPGVDRSFSAVITEKSRVCDLPYILQGSSHRAIRGAWRGRCRAAAGPFILGAVSEGPAL